MAQPAGLLAFALLKVIRGPNFAGNLRGEPLISKGLSVSLLVAVLVGKNLLWLLLVFRTSFSQNIYLF